jgi:3',5'-cyclic AMP phosphodiesterase CpdA
MDAKLRKEQELDRRRFLKITGSAAAAVTLSTYFTPRLIKVALGQDEAPSFRIAYISDTHLLARGEKHRFAVATIRAVEDVNAMSPAPDFVLFGGDLAQLGLRDELSLGKDILAKLKPKLYMMVGEHDWYFDMGEVWQEFFGKPTYSFDHKGVHFIVLNSVIVEDYWSEPKMTPMERMKFMAQLDNPQGRPFTVGDAQRNWLKEDLSKIKKDTPLIIFSHSPLYKYYKSWNFWTDDAEEVQKILSPFKSVTVIHGHTHQLLSNKIGNIFFHGMLSTAWPWPYASEGIPKLTIQMERADPFSQFDACGWGKASVSDGMVDKTYNLWERNPREVTHSYLAKGQGPKEPGPSY